MKDGEFIHMMALNDNPPPQEVDMNKTCLNIDTNMHTIDQRYFFKIHE